MRAANVWGLTAKGKRTLNTVDQFAERQVANALKGLGQRARREILSGLGGYAKALASARTGIDAPIQEARIEEGYAPGLIGRIVELHAVHYSAVAGFGVDFEKVLAGGLADFAARLEHPDNAVWSLWVNGSIVGSVAIDGEDLGAGRAHLRWFIVDDSVRGTGFGRTLLQAAVGFCDRRSFSRFSCGPSAVSMRRVISTRLTDSFWSRSTVRINGEPPYKSKNSCGVGPSQLVENTREPNEKSLVFLLKPSFLAPKREG